MKKLAFTLAEVLITIGIIGLIAAQTIPTLVKNINEAKYNVLAKKAYAELQQALTRMQSEEKEISYYSTQTEFTNELATIMKATKVSTISNIFPDKYYRYKNNIPYDYATRTIDDTEPAIITASGMSWAFITAGECYEDDFFENYAECGLVTVDTNTASNPPNMAGLDMIDFYIVSKNGSLLAIPYGSPTLIPGPYPDYPYTCAKNASSWEQSRGCSYLRIFDPAKLP